MTTRTSGLLLLFLLACSGKDKRPAKVGGGDATSSDLATAEEDAAVLGRELYDLVDQAMSYKSAHRGRLPRSLRELGVDQLTPTTQRTLVASGGQPNVTVEFRAIAHHALHSCSGTSAVLEEAAVGAGEFSMTCIPVTGGSTTLKARR